MTMQKIYTGIDAEGDRVFQRAPYIEDGVYIAEKNGFQVWDIPLGGGEPQLMETFDTFDEAIKFTNNYPYT